MKKIIATFFLLTFIASPIVSFAQTTATTVPVKTLTEVELKSKLSKIKTKQNKTKAYLKTNKSQAKTVIKQVKKARKQIKTKRLKARTTTTTIQ